MNFGGLESDNYHSLANKYCGGTPSSLLTFGIQGGFDAGVKFYDALAMIKRLVNIGDAKTLACHPASTTHRQLTEQEQLQAGVKPETLRICVGIEHIDDIWQTLSRHSLRPDSRLNDAPTAVGLIVRPTRSPLQDDSLPPRVFPCGSGLTLTPPPGLRFLTPSDKDCNVPSRQF